MSTPSASTGDHAYPDEYPQAGDVRGGSRAIPIRASDAEREDALRRLAGHYADGRLERAEFDERADAAFAALTREQLRTLFRDLPDRAQPAAGSALASGYLPDVAQPAAGSALGSGLPSASGGASPFAEAYRGVSQGRFPPRPYARAVRPPRLPAPLIVLVPLLIALAVAAALHGFPPFPLIPLIFILTRRQRRWHREARPWI